MVSTVRDNISLFIKNVNDKREEEKANERERLIKILNSIINRLSDQDSVLYKEFEKVSKLGKETVSITFFENDLTPSDSRWDDDVEQWFTCNNRKWLGKERINLLNDLLKEYRLGIKVHKFEQFYTVSLNLLIDN